MMAGTYIKSGKNYRGKMSSFLLMLLVAMLMFGVFPGTGLCGDESVVESIPPTGCSVAFAETNWRLLNMGYGGGVPVAVGDKTFIAADLRGIKDAIIQIALDSGNLDIIEGSGGLGTEIACGHGIVTMNGNWFTNYSEDSRRNDEDNRKIRAFLDYFPGHSMTDYNNAKKLAASKYEGAFMEICSENGFSSEGYPIGYNSGIYAFVEAEAGRQGYGMTVDVNVGDKKYYCTDGGGISLGIQSLAAATGDTAVIESAKQINGYHLMEVNGNWFTDIDVNTYSAFHNAFPGHSFNDFLNAKAETLKKIGEIFAKLCAEQGLDSFGYRQKPSIQPEPEPDPDPVPAPAPAFTPTLAAKIPTSGNIGTTYTVVPSAPKGYTLQSTSYSSSNPNVATVDAAGNVTYVGGGRATVTIKVVSQKTDSRGRVVTKVTTVKKTITVKQPVQSISLSAAYATIAKAQKLKLTTSFAPATASNKKLTWSSSNKRVATVSSSGVVVGKGAGTAVITCKAKDGSGVTASCTVTVTPADPTGVRLSKSSITIVVGKVVALRATVAPRNTDYKTVTWTSSDSAIATVDAKGRIKALALGTVTITATTSNGLSAACTVTVI